MVGIAQRLCIVDFNGYARTGIRVSQIHYRAITGRCIYRASDVEPRESGSVVWAETPKIYIGGLQREAYAVGRWAGKTERALAFRHDCLDTTEVECHVVEAAEGGRGSVPSRMRSAERATSRLKPTASARWVTV